MLRELYVSKSHWKYRCIILIFPGFLNPFKPSYLLLWNTEVTGRNLWTHIVFNWVLVCFVSSYINASSCFTIKIISICVNMVTEVLSSGIHNCLACSFRDMIHPLNTGNLCLFSICSLTNSSLSSRPYLKIFPAQNLTNIGSLNIKIMNSQMAFNVLWKLECLFP